MSGFEIDEPKPPKREPVDPDAVWGSPPQDAPVAPPPSPAPPQPSGGSRHPGAEPAAGSGAAAPAPAAAPPPIAPPAAAAAPAHHDHGGDEPMRQVEEVRKWILDRVPILQPIELPLQEAQGCVLAGDVSAQLDLPPFSSSAMDGFAVRSADVAEATAQNPVRLRIVGRVGGGPAARRRPWAWTRPSGSPPARRSRPAPTRSSRSRTRPWRASPCWSCGRPRTGAFIRPAGQDVARPAGAGPAGAPRLARPELGLLASAGLLVRARAPASARGDHLDRRRAGRAGPAGVRSA